VGISSRKRIVVLGKVVVSGDPDLRCQTSLESAFTLEQQLFEHLQFHMTGPLPIVTVTQPRAIRSRTTRKVILSALSTILVWPIIFCLDSKGRQYIIADCPVVTDTVSTLRRSGL
jgi:hypothetical protein